MADAATLVYDIDSTSALGAARDLQRLEKATAELANQESKLNRVYRDSRGRFQTSADFASKNKREIEALARSYNPLMAANLAYAKEVERTSRAVQIGVLTEQERAVQLANTKSSLDRAAQSSRGYAAGMNGVNNIQSSVGNQFAQLNDVVVTAWGGMNPALIGMQQGMQMVQGFAGQSVPQALGTLRGAFMQLLSPMTLLTVGVIAGGAALIQFGMSMFSAEENAKSLDDAMGNLEGAASRVNGAYRLMAAEGLEEVFQAYGRINERVIENVRILTEASILEEMNAIRSAAAAIRAEFTGGWITSDVDDIRILFGTTNDGARSILGTLEQIKNAKTFEDQSKYAIQLRDYLLSGGRAISDFEGEAQKAVISVVKMADESEKLSVQVDRAKKLGEEFSNLDLASGVISAGNAALVLAQNLNISLATAMKLAALGDQGVSKDPSGQRYSGRGGDPREMGGGFYDIANKEADAWIKKQEELKKASKGGGGGGSGADDNGVLALIESLKLKDQIQLEWYEKNRALIISQDEQDLAALGGKNAALEMLDIQHLEKMAGIKDSYRQHELNAQKAMYNELSGFLGMFAGESRIAAIAQIGINTALRVAEIQQNTAAASMRAMAELGPIAGPAAAAKIITMGKIQTGVAIAAAAASGLGGGRSGGGGGGRGGTAASTPSAPAEESTRNILLHFDGPEWMTAMVEGIATQLYEQSGNGRVIVSSARY